MSGTYTINVTIIHEDRINESECILTVRMVNSIGTPKSLAATFLKENELSLRSDKFDYQPGDIAILYINVCYYYIYLLLFLFFYFLFFM